MECTITRLSFADAFQVCARVAPSRSPKAVLQNVLLRLGVDGRAVLSATDLEVEVALTVPDVAITRPGSILLSPDRISQLLRVTQDDRLAIEGNHLDGLKIAGQSSKYMFSTDDPTLMPTSPDTPASQTISVNAAALRRGIKRTLYATDVDSTHYALGGVQFAVLTADGMLRMVGTDGRRLAVHDIPCIPPEPRSTVVPTVVIPVKALKVLEHLLPDDETDVTVGFSANNATFKVGDAKLWTRLLEGRFPAWESILERAPGTKSLPLWHAHFLAAVSQAMVVSSEESRAVDVSICPGSPGVMRLSAKTADVGQSNVTMPIVGYNGPQVDMAFDPRYVRELLLSLTGEETVTMEFADGKTPLFFKAGTTESAIMPLTRDEVNVAAKAAKPA